jgi:hypothetical protein
LCLSKRVQTKKVVHKQPNQECALAARLAAKIKQALEVKISAKIQCRDSSLLLGLCFLTGLVQFKSEIQLFFVCENCL